MPEWDESKHPRADDGKFGEGAGSAKGPTKKAAPAKKKAPSRTKARLVEARKKAKAKADEVVAKAKARAKEIKAAAKSRSDAAAAKAKAGGKKLTTAQRTRLAEARKKAKAKADDVVAKAKARAKAIKDKAGAGAGAKAKDGTTPRPPAAPDPAPAVKKAAPEAPPARAKKGPNPDPASVAGSVANDSRRRTLAHASIENGGLEVVDDPKRILASAQLSKAVQKATRASVSDTLAQYGLHDRDNGMEHGQTLEIRTPDGMGSRKNFRIEGLHWGSDGKIALDSEVAALLRDHAGLSAAGIAKLGQRVKAMSQVEGGLHSAPVRMMNAHRTMVHEGLHGMGPKVADHHPSTMVEELVTEMAARRVSADIHGLHVYDMPGSYDKYIGPTIVGLADESGKTEEEVMHALSDTCLEVKRMSGDANPRELMHFVAKHALTGLGVADSEAHDRLYQRMMGASDR